MLAVALVLAAALFGDWAWSQDKTAGQHDAGQSAIRLGMSADFSASARALSIELYRGAMAYLLPLNNAGGIKGSRVVIKAYDDRYEPGLAIRNTLKLMDDDDVFALFNHVGTPTMNRTLPLLQMHQDKDFLLFFPLTGADTNRLPPYDQLSFNLRASYDQEMKGLIDHFVAVNRSRIAVFYQADAYGRAGWGGLREALNEHGLEIAGEATYRRGSPFDKSYDRQVAIMQRLQPDAVVCVGTYPACAGFIRDMRDRDVDCPVATISFVGSGAMLKLLSAAEHESNKDYRGLQHLLRLRCGQEGHDHRAYLRAGRSGRDPGRLQECEGRLRPQTRGPWQLLGGHGRHPRRRGRLRTYRHGQGLHRLAGPDCHWQRGLSS
jgi:branched-chain amino acid transport system substrate-binding protein